MAKGYVIRRDTPAEDVVVNGRTHHLHPGHSYLEWWPYYRQFDWMTGDLAFAAVFTEEAALSKASELRLTEPSKYEIRVLEDYERREPQFTLDQLDVRVTVTVQEDVVKR